MSGEREDQVMSPAQCASQGHLPIRKEVYGPKPSDPGYWSSLPKIRWFCECGQEVWAYGETA